MSASGERDPLRVLRLPAVSSINPYQPVLYERLRRHGVTLLEDESLTLRRLLSRRPGVDVIHFQWRLDRLIRAAEDDLDGGHERVAFAPVAAGRLAWLAAALALARARGIRIAWTVHEPWRHAPGGISLDHLTGRLIARMADALMAHEHASAEQTRRYLRPRRQVSVLPLPGYAELMPPARPGARDAVRSELGVAPDEVLVLAFGIVREEKEFDLLADALGRLEGTPLRVLIVGPSRSDAVVVMLDAAAARDPRLLVQIGWVDDQRVADLYAAADLAVLCRGRELTSSSGVLALSLGVPMVATALGSTRELLGPGAWYFAARDAASLAASLDEAVAAGPAGRAARGAAGRAHVERWTFDDLAAATARELRGHAPRGAGA